MEIYNPRLLNMETKLNDNDKIEGYWSLKGNPALDIYPTPVPNVLTQDEANAVFKLIKRKEAGASVTRYRGMSMSRIDKKTVVGSMEYSRAGWRWPQGFAEHYVRDHRVKPTDAFLKFIGYVSTP